jgi:uncharacterized protein (DUF2164 family)
MSDDPRLPPEGGEELDLGEIEEDEGEDAGLHDEAGEGEAPDEGGDGEEGAEGDVEPPAPRVGRKSQAQRWRERAERLEKEAAEGRGFRQAAEQFQRFQPQQQQVNAEAERVAKWEAENLPMMSAQEVGAYYYQKGMQQSQQQSLWQQVNLKDELDRRDFESAARTNADRRRYKERVEAEYARERQAGNLRAEREKIFKLLWAEDAFARADDDAPMQRRTARGRVARAQARPTNGRGDGAAGRGKQSWGDPEFDARMAAEALRKGIF